MRGIDPLVVDGLLAAAILGLSLFAATLGPEPANRRDPDALAFLLIVLACVPLMFRRRAALPVLWIVCASATAYAAFGYPDNLIVSLVLATYTAASREPRERVRTLVAPVALVAGIAMQLARDAGPFLHDVVAHAMSVMIVQAGAARTVVERDPGEAALALRRIEDTGRFGMAEMRRLIGVLKADDEQAELMPQPGLAQLDELLETVRSTGLPVEAVTEGTPRPLPPGVDLTAYRVVQEGLTNVLKHAGVAHARATVRYEDDAIAVEVADDGRGAVADPNGTPGHGLLGMRERVAVFDGTLETGARAGGGFVLRARIPLDAEVDG